MAAREIILKLSKMPRMRRIPRIAFSSFLFMMISENNTMYINIGSLMSSGKIRLYFTSKLYARRFSHSQAELCDNNVNYVNIFYRDRR